MDLVDACIRWFDKRACDLEEMRWTWMNGGPTLAYNSASFLPSLNPSPIICTDFSTRNHSLCIHGTIIYCAGVLLKTCNFPCYSSTPTCCRGLLSSAAMLLPCSAVDCSMWAIRMHMLRAVLVDYCTPALSNDDHLPLHQHACTKSFNTRSRKLCWLASF